MWLYLAGRGIVRVFMGLGVGVMVLRVFFHVLEN